jgi:hypothetical protein
MNELILMTFHEYVYVQSGFRIMKPEICFEYIKNAVVDSGQEMVLHFGFGHEVKGFHVLSL